MPEAKRYTYELTVTLSIDADDDDEVLEKFRAESARLKDGVMFLETDYARTSNNWTSHSEWLQWTPAQRTGRDEANE